MNFERGLHDQFYTNILCYPLGNTSEAFFDKVVISLNTNASRFSVSPISDKKFLEKARNSVPKKDWNYAVIRCRCRVPNLELDWEEGRITTNCNAGIIIADMASYDVKNIENDIAMIRSMMQDNHIGSFRIFVYNHMQEQINFKDEWLNQLVSVMDQGQNSVQVQQREVEKLLIATAMNVFGVMEMLKNESHTINVFSPKDDVLGDDKKMKKIKKGRSQKLRGDLALMLGCPEDATDCYAAAYETLESNKDYLWMGRIHEANAAIVFLDYLNYGDMKIPVAKTIDMMVQKMDNYESTLKKLPVEKGRVLQNERLLKLLRVMKVFGSRSKFCSLIENIKREDYLPEEYFRMMLKVSEFFYDMKMFKKAGFFIKQAGDAVIQEGLSSTLARNIYLACLPIYNIPLPKKSLPESFPKNDFFRVLEANPVIGSEVKRVDPILQLQLINDVLSNSPMDLPLQAHLISIVLRYFMEDVDQVTQQRFFNHLIVLGGVLNNNMKLDLTLLPELVKIEPISEVLKVNIKQHEAGVDKGGVFIYNPWKRGANAVDFNWMVENVCYVKVHLRNTFEFEVFLDSIMLVTEGVRTISYPTSAILRKSKSLQEVTLKFKPLETGTMNLLGIVSKLSNFVHFHPISSKGIAIKNYSESTHSKDFIGIRKIPIKEKINTLKVFFEETAEEIKLYEGGRFCTRVMIENKNESTVCLRKLLVSFAFTDNTTLDREISVLDKEIHRYEQLSVMIYRKTKEDEDLLQEDLKIQSHILLNVFDVPNIDKMFKIYFKVIYYEQNKPNISIEDNLTKEVKMTKSLSVCDVQVNNSLHADQVTISGKSYNHVSLDDCFLLSVDVIRDDPETNDNDYAVSIYLKGVEQSLKEQIMLGSLSSMKLTARLDRSLVSLSGCEDITKMLFGKWKDLNSIDTGYLSFNNLETRNIIEQSKDLGLKFDINAELPLVNGQYEAELGELKTYKVKISLNNNGAKKLYTSVAFSEDVNNEQVLLLKKERGVVYRGKKSFLVEFEEGEKEKEIEVKAMFTEARNYNLFCFGVDEESSVVYSYKYPFYFKVK